MVIGLFAISGFQIFVSGIVRRVYKCCVDAC